ncbi:unnamed protein product [Rotaria sordida]|uniref:NmrA-like domain-containing protein n=1 Tax=Rotaria sordida TaxID=392033 RepID=A0A815J0P7_9BILA|nr:unnamed protein product [Rotaria sordida]CAF1342189.1 unnamed protein product [Rotaria sordida]CAF1370130.1 unnamed protein product [Rotaria sordida]CAF1375998.1 unnamed protein product [Rotaria sordida]CAF1613883.1 unnamed protein product [Rotaria sordida]
MSYVVTGASGQVGSAVVDYLLAQSLPVRAVIRSENKAESFRSRHVEVAIADLTDGEALTKSFQGAKVVFAMNSTALTSPDLQAAAVKVSHALASAIKAAKVERVVVLSSVGAERSSKTGNILTTHTLEEALKGTAPQVVMVRAASFMENWNSAVSAVKSGQSSVLGSAFQKLDRKFPHVATNDIGRVVAEYMTKPSSEVDKLVIIELEGPQDYSPNDVAKVVSDALGKTVPAAAMTEEMMCDLFNKLGFPKTTIDNYIEMVRGFDDNTIRWTTDENVIRIKGKLTLADVLNKN